MSEKFSYTEVKRMTIDEVREVCFALEYYDELVEEELENKKKDKNSALYWVLFFIPGRRKPWQIYEA